MPIFEFQQPRFTEGVLAKSLQGRSSEEFYTYGVKSAKNMIPLLEGPMIKRPGTVYVSEAGNTTSRLFPFYKGGTEAYVVEIGYDSGASDTTLGCSVGSGATTVTTTGNTNTIFVGQHIWGTGLDSNTTAYPTTQKDSSTQVASITDATHFELSNVATAAIVAVSLSCTTQSSTTVLASDTTGIVVGQVVSGTGIPTSPAPTVVSIVTNTSFVLSATATGSATVSLTFRPTLNFSNKPFIRIYSQNRLLSVYNTSTTYLVKSHRWITVTGLDELASLEASQSGDVLFFTCPTRKPFLLTRTLDTTTTTRAEDNSIWTVSEYDSEDGPYGNVNAENTLSMAISSSGSDVETEEDIADVQFDVKNNLIIVANHGLQTGQRINLHVDNITNAKTGNTQIIIKDGTVDPTVTVLVTPNATTHKFTTTKSHGLQDNDIVHIGGTHPTGGTWVTANTGSTPVDAATDLFVVTARLYTFQLAFTEEGTPLTYTGIGSGTYFGTNKAADTGAFLAGDRLLGDPTVISPTDWPDWTTANTHADNYFYVVYSTSVAFQISDSPSNKAFDINYIDLDAAVPPVSGTQFSGKVTLKRRKYLKDSNITVTSRVKVGATWQVADANNGTVFVNSDVGRLIRLNPLADTTTRRGGIRWAWGTITARLTAATATVKLKTDASPNPDPTNGSPEWRLGAFSGYSNYSTGVFEGNGFPKISQIYQQRFVFASTNLEPSTIWLSRTANFYSFSPTELALQDTPVITGGITSEVIVDSNAVTFTIDSDTLDEIMWLIDSKKLAIGTSAGVYFLYGTETNLAVTPTTFSVSRETSYSATTINPVVVSNVVIYPQRGGKEIQELEFSGAEDQWLQSRISMKAYDMISESSVIKIAWQERPNPIVWFVLDNGQVLTLSYDRSVKFKAWSTHTFGGTHAGGIAKVTDIAIIPRTDYDQVWFKIKRTINGSEVSYIEILDRFPSENAITRNELIFLDSSKIHRRTEIFPLTTDIPIVKGASQAITQDELIVDGATSAPPANMRFLIAGDTTVYKVLSATTPTSINAWTSTWTLDQNLVAVPLDNAAIELRLQELTVDHLKNESIGLCTNGMEHANLSVGNSGATNGKATLNHTLATTTISGLSYTAQMETLSPPTPDNQYTFNKRLLTFTALIQDSLGIEIEYNANTEEFLFRSTQQNTGEPIDFFNGFKKNSLSGSGWESHSVIIRSTSPLPMQINSLSIELETGGA